jgi:hypothetical protein
LTIVTMVSLGNGVHREMLQSFDSIGLESVRLLPVAEDSSEYNLFGERQRTLMLTPELVRDLAARPGILSVEPTLYFPQGMRLILEMDGQEIRLDPRSRSATYVPDPFESLPRTLAGEEDPPPAGGGLVIGQDVWQQLDDGQGQPADLVGREVRSCSMHPGGIRRPLGCEL